MWEFWLTITSWLKPFISLFGLLNLTAGILCLVIVSFLPFQWMKYTAVGAGVLFISVYLSYVHGEHKGYAQCLSEWNAANDRRANEERLRDQRIADSTRAKVKDAVEQTEQTFKDREDDISRRAVQRAMSEPDTRRKLCAFNESDFEFLRDNAPATRNP